MKLLKPTQTVQRKKKCVTNLMQNYLLQYMLYETTGRFLDECLNVVVMTFGSTSDVKNNVGANMLREVLLSRK